MNLLVFVSPEIALASAIEDNFVSVAENGGYFQRWPRGLISIELDDLDLLRFAGAVLRGVRGVTTSSAADVIRAAEERIEAARFGLNDLRQRPERMRSGLYNAVVFGRMVTFALQNMRNTVPGFDDWYLVKQGEMRSDPLMRFFHDLRTEIEKQTKSHASVSEHIHSFSGMDIARFGPPPPNARGLFIMDENGGSGWEVVRSDGSIEKYYVDLPPDIGEVNIHLIDAPENLRHIPAADLVERYLSRLQSIIAEAKERFVV